MLEIVIGLGGFVAGVLMAVYRLKGNRTAVRTFRAMFFEDSQGGPGAPER